MCSCPAERPQTKPNRGCVCGTLRYRDVKRRAIFASEGNLKRGHNLTFKRKFGFAVLFAVLGVVAAIAILMELWFAAIVPEHRMEKFDCMVTVTVGGHAVPAEYYEGFPTHNEEQVIVLVDVERVGDYFVDMYHEKVRKGDRSQYLVLRHGVWCYRSMRAGRFVEPMYWLREDEFRIAASNGHVVTLVFWPNCFAH
jgi:hypothetical protein